MRYICAISPGGNDRKHLFSDNEYSLANFAATWDSNGYHIYDCVAELLPEAQVKRERSLDTVASLSFAHVDVDLKNIAAARDKVLTKLQAIPSPLEIRDSGGGFHILALLKEPAEAGTDEFERVNAVRRKLTCLLAGDPAPDHAAALLRRVGTNNYKFDPPRPCCVIQKGVPTDITEVEELIELLGETPLFVRNETPKANGHAAPNGQADTTYDRSALSVPASGRLDIEAAFAAMPPDGAGANEFQPPIIRAMLLEGRTLEAIRSEVAERTVATVRAAGLPWTVDDEREPVEQRIKACLNRLYKESNHDPTSGEIPEWLPEELHEAWTRVLREGNRPIIHKNR
jgi:hypothetical protein